MNDKAKHDGSPNVLFLEEALERKWGKGFARVICPITDPFVRHHGALGSFVRLYRNDKSVDNDQILEFCRSLPEVELALAGDEAAARFEMPLDREGDFVVIAKKNAVIGSRKEEHDMSTVMDHRLRSHGGLSEQSVPLLRSTPTKRATIAAAKCWRNFDVFDLALNE
jgi:phosphonoacetate hydrolase